jgi:hypothetical protein
MPQRWNGVVTYLRRATPNVAVRRDHTNSRPTSAAALRREGIGSDERVTLTIEPGEELIPGLRASRARVVAAGLTDDDIDRLIKQAQRDVEPRPG